jgi:glutamyl-tRNA reductase
MIYPTDYTDEDKAIYDDLISRGEALIGKKLNKQDSFLLDLAAKITINKMNGKSNNLTDEEIDALKSRHKEAQEAGIIQTPPDIFYQMLKHPLEKPAEEYYKEYNTNFALE